MNFCITLRHPDNCWVIKKAIDDNGSANTNDDFFKITNNNSQRDTSTGDGNDYVVGGSKQDFIFSGKDDDQIFGRGGDDVISGDSYVYTTNSQFLMPYLKI